MTALLDDAAERRIRDLAERGCALQTVQSPAFVVDAVTHFMRIAWREATEAAATKCESEKTKLYDSVSGSQTHAYNDACNDCAAAIRGGKL